MIIIRPLKATLVNYKAKDEKTRDAREIQLFKGIKLMEGKVKGIKTNDHWERFPVKAIHITHLT